MRNLVYIYIFIFSLLLSIGFTPLARSFALKLNILDRPSSPRKIHRDGMPLLGGIAIFLSFALTILVNLFIFFTLKDILPSEIASFSSGIKAVSAKLTAILIGGGSMMLLGLFDDLRPIGAWVKLSGQVLVGILSVLAGLRISLFLTNPIIGGLITVLWIVAITNAFNLLDNMDGLAAGVAIIASVLFFVISFQGGQFFVCTVLAVFAGSLLGFLRYNFTPSSIFMGDSGSLFIGYTLSILTIMSTYYTKDSPTIIPVIMPVLILGVPIFDTLSVMGIRIKNKRPLFGADKSHFSHRLVELGMSRKEAVLFIYLLTFCIGTGALLLNRVSVAGGLTILFQALGIITIIVLLEKAGKRKIL